MVPVTGSLVAVKALNPQTVSIRRPDSSVEQNSCNNPAKAAAPETKPHPKPPCVLHDHFRILNLPARLHRLTFASHGTTFKNRSASSRSTTFEDLTLLLHDLEDYRALDYLKVSKKLEYVT